MKTRKITLHKNEVHYDCEAHAFKLMDVIGPDVKIKNAVAADSGDILDGRMLSRYTDLRDAEIRKRLAFCIADGVVGEVDDIPSNDPLYIYNISMADNVKDSLLIPVKTYLHEYLVRGTLYDWYEGCRISPNPIDKGEVESFLDKAVADLRGRSWVKAPMQPFGPQKKMN